MTLQTMKRPQFRFRIGDGRSGDDSPTLARFRAIAARTAPDPAGEGLRLARRRALEEAHLAWRGGDDAGEAVCRAIADGLRRELSARLVRS